MNEGSEGLVLSQECEYKLVLDQKSDHPDSCHPHWQNCLDGFSTLTEELARRVGEMGECCCNARMDRSLVASTQDY